MKPLIVLFVALIIFFATVGHLRAQEPAPPQTDPGNDLLIPDAGCEPEPERPLPAELLKCGTLRGHFTDLAGTQHAMSLRIHRVWPKDAPAPHMEVDMVIGTGDNRWDVRVARVRVPADGTIMFSIELEDGPVVMLTAFAMNCRVNREAGRVTLWSADALGPMEGTFHLVGEWDEAK